MVNVNKDFMDGFVVALALIDITSNPNATEPIPVKKTAKMFKTALASFKAADKKLIDPNELKEALENLYDIKFPEVGSNG